MNNLTISASHLRAIFECFSITKRSTYDEYASRFAQSSHSNLAQTWAHKCLNYSFTSPKINMFLKKKKGQAAVEMAFALPFLIWLIYYTINAFHTIHTSHVAQKAAAMSLYQRLANRSKFEVDEVAATLHRKGFMAVQYTDPNGKTPRRKILLQTKNPPRALNVVGVCKEPDCN